MTADHYQLAIVGSGPSGLAAAAYAAKCNLSHILLEKEDHLAHTIFSFQKGKHVMDEPAYLPLQDKCPLAFHSGPREQILSQWNQIAADHNINIHYRSEIADIGGEQGDFTLTLTNGSTLQAQNVLLAIGMGAPRKMGIPGESAPQVQYNLADPDAYEDEHIVIVGAGDAAIENALALCTHNTIYLVNRKGEFNRAKQANIDAILKNIAEGSIECFYDTNASRIATNAENTAQIRFVLDTLNGEAEINCDRIIVRAGNIPARYFLEKIGIEYASTRSGFPILSTAYETNIKGIYAVGALGGYPLIKQCINQGYEVVEYILGNPVQPADEPLLVEKFSQFQSEPNVSQVLQDIQNSIPLFRDLNHLQMRELILDSEIVVPAEGDYIFEVDDFSDSFYCIYQGEVHIEAKQKSAAGKVSISAGNFFGELSLISGRRRSASIRAGKGCILIDTPRRSMLKWIASVSSIKKGIDEASIVNAIRSLFQTSSTPQALLEIAKQANIRQYKPGETIFTEGDDADSMHLIRSGSVTVSRNLEGREVIINYLPVGNYIGEMGVMGKCARSATIKAATATETIELSEKTFQALLAQDDQLRARVQQEYRNRLDSATRAAQFEKAGSVMSFLVAQGVGGSADVLLIDESICIRCNNCEFACAQTHDGTSRLDREAGSTFANIHVPTSCHHCEDPLCMKDCPPDAIHRSSNGEVYVEDNCIGCGNCQRNCPYGVIQIAAPAVKKPTFLQKLMHRFNSAAVTPNDTEIKKAVKCDMCRDLSGGPACVRACPTGAALRISSDKLPHYVGLA